MTVASHSRIIAGATIAAVVSIDLITKHAITTEPGLAHHTPNWAKLMITAAALTAACITKHPPSVTSPIAAVAGGALANAIDAIDNTVRNPLTVRIADGTVGFNTADIAIIAGSTMFVIKVVRPTLTRILTGSNTQNPVD